MWLRLLIERFLMQIALTLSSVVHLNNALREELKELIYLYDKYFNEGLSREDYEKMIHIVRKLSEKV